MKHRLPSGAGRSLLPTVLLALAPAMFSLTAQANVVSARCGDSDVNVLAGPASFECPGFLGGPGEMLSGVDLKFSAHVTPHDGPSGSTQGVFVRFEAPTDFDPMSIVMNLSTLTTITIDFEDGPHHSISSPTFGSFLVQAREALAPVAVASRLTTNVFVRYTFDVVPVPVPEPSSLLLAAAGLGIAAPGVRWRRRAARRGADERFAVSK